MFQGKNLAKDFEIYLVKNKLWKPYHENEHTWIERLGERMDVAAKRTAEENKKITEEDIGWWIDLCMLQKAYGSDVDIFGSYLEERGMSSVRNSQFFTPMSICELLAVITAHDGTETNKNEPVKVNDCASGTGRMMIAHANVAARKPGYNPLQYQYYNQDIDYKSFIFSTLNAVLRNLLSVNVWGDTLAVTERKTFFTIPTNLGYATWHDREHELARIIAANSCMEKEPRKPIGRKLA